MLTKEERKEIAERLSSVTELGDRAFYEAITGEQRPDTTSYEEDLKAMFNVVINLCDTSNMIELPLGKDGEFIHIGDTVADGADGQICRVRGYEFKLDDCSVLLTSDRSHIWTYSRPDTLTHKKPVTPELLSTQIRRVIDKGEMTSCAMAELFDIADQLESLGDSDDYEDKGEDSNGSC